LTEEIDCPYKPTSRDSIYSSFRAAVVKDILSLSLTLPLTLNLTLYLTISHVKHVRSGGCSFIILPSIHHGDQFWLLLVMGFWCFSVCMILRLYADST